MRPGMPLCSRVPPAHPSRSFLRNPHVPARRAGSLLAIRLVSASTHVMRRKANQDARLHDALSASNRSGWPPPAADAVAGDSIIRTPAVNPTLFLISCCG
mgnify:CR=1 FL=1